jgi:hypothetical protein
MGALSRDMAHRHEEEIGKETAHAHKLLCRLRHAGAMRDDLVKMRDVDAFAFTELVARARGIKPSDHEDPDLRLINLDHEPGIQESLKGLSYGFVDDDSDVIRDGRLGIWPVMEDKGAFIFGDMKSAVRHPTGLCVDGNRFCLGDLKGIPRECKHLNLAMASWFSRGGRIDILFDTLSLNSTDKYISIYFLGTVWWNSERKCYYAPALVMRNFSQFNLEISQIPNGNWPRNHFVAIVVPK